MTAVPIFPLNAEELLADLKLKRLMRSGEKRAMWLWLLTTMWLNKAWLPADEQTIAAMLGIDVRRWKVTYKPIFEQLLVREHQPLVGDIYRQPKLTDVWNATVERITKNKRLAADARAAKAAKHGQSPSAAERPSGPAPEPAAAPVTEPAAGLHQNQDKKGPASGHPNGPAQPGPFTAVPLRSGPGGEVAPPSDPALVKRLVSDGLKRPRATGLMAALEPREDDDQ